jgi:hypothetical protein
VAPQPVTNDGVVTAVIREQVKLRWSGPLEKRSRHHERALGSLLLITSERGLP